MLIIGFLDPEQVIRGVHLIPTFARGHTSERLGPSITCQPTENDEDWEGYYINMYVFYYNSLSLFLNFL